MPLAAATPETGQLDASTPILTIQGPRATIRLNRPRQHNRVEPADITAIRAMLSDIAANPDLHVLVLTGTGNKSFSSGYHIGDLAEKKASGRAEQGSGFEDMADQLEELPIATICALNGSVYGGSTDLALACDFRIGVQGSRMFMPAARLGIHYYPGGLRRYVTRMGLAAAKKLFMTAQPIDAEEMRRVGYLDEVVPAERLQARVDELAAIIAENAPLAVRGMKRALNKIAAGAMDVAEIQANSALCRRSEDHAEGIRAWAEKRKPVFRGR
jgi:enoyl-CoA hydratase